MIHCSRFQVIRLGLNVIFTHHDFIPELKNCLHSEITKNWIPRYASLTHAHSQALLLRLTLPALQDSYWVSRCVHASTCNERMYWDTRHCSVHSENRPTSSLMNFCGWKLRICIYRRINGIFTNYRNLLPICSAPVPLLDRNRDFSLVSNLLFQKASGIEVEGHMMFRVAKQ